MQRLTLPIKKLTPDAIIPTSGTPFSIGLDLYANVDRFVEPGARCVVLTGISAAIPPTHYGRVAPRSGLARKYGVDVLAGVIDCDYRGDISVMVINHGDSTLMIRKGERIGQLILERADMFNPVETDKLTETDRGAKGFGSTGSLAL